MQVVYDQANNLHELKQLKQLNTTDVDALLDAMKNDRFIEAIKAYRALTGMGLRESNKFEHPQEVSNG